MKHLGWLVVLPLAVGPWGNAAHGGAVLGRRELERTNTHLHGTVIDYTHNHGADHRLWSPALEEKRDLYVYLPPCFDPSRQYPFLMWFHGFAQDEQAFLRDVVGPLDGAIVAGKLPPLIIAAPDGSVDGRGRLFSGGSFFLNTKAGDFEDYVMKDVWTFMMQNYPIRPEREAHILAGASMGGGAAFNLGIKYRDRVKYVIGIFPPVNVRWMDCHGNYRSNFDPCCWGWRTDVHHGCEVIARFYGVIPVRARRLLNPIYERRNPETLDDMIRENPIEMLDAYHVQEGQLAMYIAYGGRDEFNIDAQVESFLYRAHERGLTVSVGYDPKGRHNVETALKLFPDLLAWLGPQLAAYYP